MPRRAASSASPPVIKETDERALLLVLLLLESELRRVWCPCTTFVTCWRGEALLGPGGEMRVAALCKVSGLKYRGLSIRCLPSGG